MDNNINTSQFFDKLNNSNWDFTIFEEGTNSELHEEFINFAAKLEAQSFENENIDKDIQQLLDKNVDLKQKKVILTKLAFSPEVKAFRAIEQFAKENDNELKDWAIISMQQSRSILETVLSEKSQVYVSSGMGGIGNKLRFMGIFKKNENIENFSDFHFNIIKKEINFTLNQNEGILEELNFYEDFISFIFIIPIQISLRNVLDKIVDDCNELGNFLSENIYVTNNKRLNEQEIKELLNKNNKENKKLDIN